MLFEPDTSDDAGLLTIVPCCQGWKSKCILDWSKTDVSSWLKSKEWGDTFVILKEPDGQDLASMELKDFEEQLVDLIIAKRMMKAVTLTLKGDLRSKRIVDAGAYDDIMEVRGECQPCSNPPPA